MKAKAPANSGTVSRAEQAATYISHGASLVCAQSLGVREGDVGGRCPVSLLVGDDLHAVVRPHANAPGNGSCFLVGIFVHAAFVSIIVLQKKALAHTVGCKYA